MITKINFDFKEDEIYELTNSEPLYIYHNGKLEAITPREYNICVITLPEDRWFNIVKDRFYNH
jgi:hypothetical protein